MGAIDRRHPPLRLTHEPRRFGDVLPVARRTDADTGRTVGTCPDRAPGGESDHPDTPLIEHDSAVALDATRYHARASVLAHRADLHDRARCLPGCGQLQACRLPSGRWNRRRADDLAIMPFIVGPYTEALLIGVHRAQ